VACLDLVPDSVEQTSVGIGNDAIAMPCDVSDWAQVEETVAAATVALGHVDVLFNVAGIGGFDESHVVDPARFERILAVNLTGSFLMCRAVLPQMVERGRGSIVNTASTAGVMGQPWSAAYCASKGGVVMLTKALATEYDPPLCVNAVAPGGVETPLYGQFIPPEGVDWNRLKKMSRDDVPPAPPAVLANTYAFLGSDEASYMTGSIVVADGGITA